MKKLITFSIICIVACMGFSSCMSNLAITKRHYNKGYYIDRSETKELALLAKEKATGLKVAAPAYPIQTTIAEKDANSSTSVQIVKTDKTIIAASAKKTRQKAVLTSTTSSMIVNLPVAVEPSVLRANSSVSGLNAIADHGDGGRDALSLFWLIILIILIVWVIGLIAGGWGLGGFINILLVIALILLILWLLRVV